MITLTQPRFAATLAVFGGVLVLCAVWLGLPVQAAPAPVAASADCASPSVMDKAKYPGIDIKLLVHRPDIAPSANGLGV